MFSISAARFTRLSRSGLLNLQRIEQVIASAHVRIQRVLLKDERDITLLWFQSNHARNRRQLGVVDPDQHRQRSHSSDGEIPNCLISVMTLRNECEARSIELTEAGRAVLEQALPAVENVDREFFAAAGNPAGAPRLLRQLPPNRPEDGATDR
jgi:hypothetical protein